MSGGKGGGNKVLAFLPIQGSSGRLSPFPEHSFINQQIFIEHCFITRIYRQNYIGNIFKSGLCITFMMQNMTSGCKESNRMLI